MAAMPKTAMVFAAGLGARMRPLTLTLPKPLIEVAGRALIDHCLDRFAENRVTKAIVNVHWLPEQIEAHLAARRAPEIVISDERELLLDQGGGIKKALPRIGREPFFICNTDAFWIEGPRSNLERLADAFDPDAMDAILLVAASAGAIGVDWPGDFTMTREGRLEAREPRHVAPFVYTGVGIVKPQLFEAVAEDVFRLGAVLLPRRRAWAAVRGSARWALAACRRPEDDRGGGAGDRPFDAVGPAPERCIAARTTGPRRFQCAAGSSRDSCPVLWFFKVLWAGKVTGAKVRAEVVWRWVVVAAKRKLRGGDSRIGDCLNLWGNAAAAGHRRAFACRACRTMPPAFSWFSARPCWPSRSCWSCLSAPSHIGVFDPAYGGDPLLFQHLFWFYSHPAVYIMILPGMGVISEVVSTFSRKRVFGYTAVAFSSVAIAVFGFFVWAHHMFIMGISNYAALVFSLLTMLVAVPSAIKIFNWAFTLYKGSITFETPMLYAFGFMGLFTIGGMTGVFLGATGTDIHLTETYFIVAHFHFVMVGGMLMAFLSGIHFWWPKWTGRMYPEKISQLAARGHLHRLQLHVLPAVHPGHAGHAAPLRRLSAGVPGAERLLHRGREHSGRGLPAADSVPHLVAEVRRHRRQQSLAGDGARVADAVAAAHRELP